MIDATRVRQTSLPLESFKRSHFVSTERASCLAEGVDPDVSPLSNLTHSADVPADDFSVKKTSMFGEAEVDITRW